MTISRRRLLADGAVLLGFGRYARGLGLGGYAWADEFPPVVLEFAGVELDPDLPLVAGANTSGFNMCHLQVLDGQGKKVVWQSKEWTTEPNRSNSAATEKLGGGDKSHVVQGVMRPTRAGTPSMALAIHQGNDLDKTQMELLAEQARFVADPAQRPDGGHFEVRLFFNSKVMVQIWKGNSTASGVLVSQNEFHNVQAGSNRVPWDLKIKGGGMAAPGRYVAWLTCTPNQAGRKPTFLGSSFGVA